jgi:hypothetical protein
MAISWFCIGCLEDCNGEVPMSGKCTLCLFPNLYNDIIARIEGGGDTLVQ